MHPWIIHACVHPCIIAYAQCDIVFVHRSWKRQNHSLAKRRLQALFTIHVPLSESNCIIEITHFSGFTPCLGFRNASTPQFHRNSSLTVWCTAASHIIHRHSLTPADSDIHPRISISTPTPALTFCSLPLRARPHVYAASTRAHSSLEWGESTTYCCCGKLISRCCGRNSSYSANSCVS